VRKRKFVAALIKKYNPNSAFRKNLLHEILWIFHPLNLLVLAVVKLMIEPKLFVLQQINVESFFCRNSCGGEMVLLTVFFRETRFT
jgi:hypothetical protein